MTAIRERFRWSIVLSVIVVLLAQWGGDTTPQMIASLPSTISGTQAQQLFGGTLQRIADMNADSRPDFAISSLAPAAGGRVDIFSGSTGGILRSIQPTLSAGTNFGAAIAQLGDLDGDAIPDLAIGSPGATTGLGSQTGVVQAVSTADGHIIYTINGPIAGGNFGFVVMGIGDVNGDGSLDIAVGAPNAANAGLLGAGFCGAYSGANGALIWQRPGAAQDAHLGLALATIGHLDGDGVDDLAIGVPGTSIGTIGGAGAIVLVSGVNGNPLRQINGTTLGEHMGSSVARIDDMDGDGHADIAATHRRSILSGLGALSIAVLSTGTGATIREISPGAADAGLEVYVATMENLDADGKADLLVAVPTSIVDGDVVAYTAKAISTANGGLLWQSPFGLGGGSVGSLGDLDGSGKITILVGDPFADPAGLANAGSVSIFGLP